jgi:predicted nucleic acid-binding Zn ribbon protein
MDEQKCKHDLCSCTVNKGNDFCSDHCREATEHEILEIKCDCGCLNCG